MVPHVAIQTKVRQQRVFNYEIIVYYQHNSMSLKQQKCKLLQKMNSANAYLSFPAKIALLIFEGEKKAICKHLVNEKKYSWFSLLGG